jgi:hypothetical protein
VVVASGEAADPVMIQASEFGGDNRSGRGLKEAHPARRRGSGELVLQWQV